MNPSQPVTIITSRTVALLEDDIDTDQMVPARFLRTSLSEGLGSCLFYDRRFTDDGQLRPDFALNPPRYQGQRILIGGANFGCGSSREHAPWAFKDFGIDVILAPSFGDIFYHNCLKNALLAIVIDAKEHGVLSRWTKDVRVDLERQVVEAGSLQVAFAIDPLMRLCLLRGLSQVGYIAAQEALIASFERQHQQRLQPLHGVL